MFLDEPGTGALTCTVAHGNSPFFAPSAECPALRRSSFDTTAPGRDSTVKGNAGTPGAICRGVGFRTLARPRRCATGNPTQCPSTCSSSNRRPRPRRSTSTSARTSPSWPRTGHVRDLVPKEGAVEPEHRFRMHYEGHREEREAHRGHRRAAKSADDVYLATDPDREGEAISWHIAEILKAPRLLDEKPVHRVVCLRDHLRAIREAMERRARS